MTLLGRWTIAAFVLVAGISASEATKPFSAQHKRWWAIQPVQKPAVPAVRDKSWVLNDIDAFVLARLEEKQIQPSPPASKITWIRRTTLDLTGLLPEQEHVQAFLADDSPDSYRKVVDRLLASPQYGERWARHWLDLARYADSEGFKSDETRPNIWRFRDYVIDSFNQDKPYDRFLKEQIAGDELYPDDPQALVATGFNRHFPDESNARNLMQRRQELLNDITDTVGSTMLGLTYACARCHDHKFDPILHKDYYRLQAFFANTRIEDSANLLKQQEQADWKAQFQKWDEQTRGIREQMRVLAEPVLAKLYSENYDKFPPEIQSAIDTRPEDRTPFQWQMYYKAKPQLYLSIEDASKKLTGADAKRWKELEAQLNQYGGIKPADLPVAQAMIDNSAASPKTHVLRGGAWDAPEAEVQPGFLTILDASDARITPTAASTGRRAALANWIASPANPLTARVMVNRVWHYHFGRGIVGTPSDFGLMGERPTHKDLLDYLAATFVEDGWSLKSLHRRILLSNVYRQSSTHREGAAKLDPDNKLLWRFTPRRLEGEAIRDAMLQVSGGLNLKMHGPGVFPPLPPGVVTRGGWKRDEDPAEARRRSIYIFVRRNTRYPMFEAFDMPDTHEPCARRNSTLTAPQALELLNNELVLDWAREFAGRVLNDSGLTPESRVERAWRLAYLRKPTQDEVRSSLNFLQRHRETFAGRDSELVLPSQMPDGMTREDAAAFVDLCHMLFNANEFVYLN